MYQSAFINTSKASANVKQLKNYLYNDDIKCHECISLNHYCETSVHFIVLFNSDEKLAAVK